MKIVLLLALCCLTPPAFTQTTADIAGDSPEAPGPYAANLSTALTLQAVNTAMKKVVTWQLAHVGLTGEQPPIYTQKWTYAALYDGLLAYSKATGDPAGHDAVLRMAESFRWQLIDTRFPHADDEALGQAYLDLYAEHPSPERIASIEAIMDRLVARPDEPKPVWWWCDALFMAPPVLVRLSTITGDHKYIDYMNHEWDITAKLLYNPDDRLYLRDERFLDRAKQHEANGQPIYWSRGDGWVVAALVNILTYLPPNDTARPRYERQFREMLTRIAALQPADGLWRTGLLDTASYKNPEVSGSAFFTFAMAYGVNHGLLDARIVRPVIERAWAAMIHHIYQDGRLGSIQPVGFAPDQFSASSSYVYGVGAFLLAGAEIDRMAAHPAAKQKR